MDLENRNELPNSLEEHWMPFTSNHDFKDSPRLMVKAEGMYYTDHHGNQLIDASSGLFVALRVMAVKKLEKLFINNLNNLTTCNLFNKALMVLLN